MPKSYSAFNYEDLKMLGLKVIADPLFVGVTIPPMPPSDFLLKILARNARQNMRSEKAKSEFIISPILTELHEYNQDRFAFYSGYKFSVDLKLGLTGFCDFILSLEPKAVTIEAPVFFVVESKNDNLDSGIAQCIAEMYAAQLFNQKQGRSMPVIYGAVTLGLEWKFIQLTGSIATIDSNVFYLNQLPEILGVLQYIVNNA
jgi:tetrahydromethanopterin S-methyltransferase subunit G